MFIDPQGGGVFDIRKVLSGDSSLSALELWGAEFQENDGLLLKPESLELFRSICERECAPFSVVGTVTVRAPTQVHGLLRSPPPACHSLEHRLWCEGCDGGRPVCTGRWAGGGARQPHG